MRHEKNTYPDRTILVYHIPDWVYGKTPLRNEDILVVLQETFSLLGLNVINPVYPTDQPNGKMAYPEYPELGKYILSIFRNIPDDMQSLPISISFKRIDGRQESSAFLTFHHTKDY
jgi:hypothetical protein